MSGTACGGPNHPIVVAPLDFALPVASRRECAGGAGGRVAGSYLPRRVSRRGSGRRPEGQRTARHGGVDGRAGVARSSDVGRVFTTNAFAAAPVVLNRTECDLDHLVAVAMNSGNANACTGEPGLAVARAMQQACAEELGVPAEQVAVGSTGIIGVQLDAGFMAAGVARKRRRR